MKSENIGAVCCPSDRFQKQQHRSFNATLKYLLCNHHLCNIMLATREFLRNITQFLPLIRCIFPYLELKLRLLPTSTLVNIYLFLLKCPFFLCVNTFYVILFWVAKKYLCLYIIFITILAKIFHPYKFQVLGTNFMHYLRLQQICYISVIIICILQLRKLSWEMLKNLPS